MWGLSLCALQRLSHSYTVISGLCSQRPGMGTLACTGAVFLCSHLLSVVQWRPRAVFVLALPQVGLSQWGWSVLGSPGHRSALPVCLRRHHGRLEPVWGPQGCPEVHPHRDYPGHCDDIFHLYP